VFKGLMTTNPTSHWF